MLFISLMFSSCQNDPIEITRPDVKISVILNNVLSPFKAYRAEDLELDEEDGIKSKIKVVSLIYDDAGKLIDSHSQVIPDYSTGQISFNTSVSGSNPTIVTLSFGTWTASNGEVVDAFSISGQNLLSTLEIKGDYDLDVYSIPWKVLGANITKLGTTSSANIVLKPLGGLVYTNWRNIHSHDSESPAPEYFVLMYKNNDIARIENGKFVFSCSLSSVYYHVSYIRSSVNPDYNNIYGYQFFFPGSFEITAYGGYYDSAKEMQRVGYADNKTVKVEDEKQYVYIFDCSDYTISFKEGVFE